MPWKKVSAMEERLRLVAQVSFSSLRSGAQDPSRTRNVWAETPLEYWMGFGAGIGQHGE
jgi:hypothetical protein